MATGEAMQSIAEDCTPLKAKYDTCFNTWFKNSYLKGGQDHDQVCGEVFAAYQKCLQKYLEKEGLSTPELYEDVLGTDNEKKPK